ncbi:hypothetical protein HPB49_012395 [Dermacentor silvarum]|uniref:Uncharacterized protein n=1 Tax=Dermacentor silvarum TaxID=543639 RepID=A0ACB8CXE3_DERSI|nr:hypothetical protein HPB49_012395 [Dermacentor silvarum]
MGEPRCVPARSLYQPCRFHQECNHTISAMRCVESLCLCPTPFESTAKGGCTARLTTSAVPSTTAVSSSADSVVIATSVETSSPTSDKTDETKTEESSRPDSGPGNVISSSSNDVANVHVTQKCSTTSAAGTGLLPASVRLLPFKSTTSTHSLSIKWGANISSSSSLKRNTATREKPLKSAMIPGKAVLPDDDDSEVPSGMAGSRRQKNVAFAVDAKPEGDESTSRPEASEDKEQSSTATEALWISQSVHPDAKLSPEDATCEAIEKVIVATEKSSSTAAPSPSNGADHSEHTLEERGVKPSSKLMVLPCVSSESKVLPKPGDVVPDSSHQAEVSEQSGTPGGCHVIGHFEPGSAAAVIVGSPLLSPMPPLPLIRRRFDLGCKTMSGKLGDGENARVLLGNPAGSVKSLVDADREEPSVRKVNTDADSTGGVTLQDLQSVGVEETSDDNGSGFAVGGLPDIIPSIKATPTSGFEGRLDTVVLGEPGYVDDVRRQETPASASGSFTGIENRSVESQMSTPGLSEMARVPFGATCSYSDLQSQGWPPASSRSTWGSFEKVPFTGRSDLQVAADFAGPSIQPALFAERPDTGTPLWSSVDKGQPSSRAGTLTSETSARPTPMKRSLRFRRTESSQLQAVSQFDSQEETPFSPSHTPFFSEAETIITSLMECEAVPERNRIPTSSGPEDPADIRFEASANMPLQEAPSESPEQSLRPRGVSVSDISAADTSESSTKRLGVRFKPTRTRLGSAARRQFSEPLPNQRLAVIHELNAEKSSGGSFSSVSDSTVSKEVEDACSGETRLSWSSPALVSVCEDASHSLQLEYTGNSSLVKVSPNNASFRHTSLSTLGIGGSREACYTAESQWSALDDTRAAAAEGLKHLQLEPPGDLKVAPSPLPRTLMSVLRPEAVQEGDCCSSSVELEDVFQTTQHVPRTGLKVLSARHLLLECSGNMEASASTEAMPTNPFSLRSHSNENTKRGFASEIHIAVESSDDVLQAQSPPFYPQPTITFAPATTSTSTAFVVSTIAGSSSSRDSPLSSAICRLPDARAADDAVCRSSDPTSMTPKPKTVHLPYSGRHSASSETLSSSVSRKAKRWQRLSTFNNVVGTKDAVRARSRLECFSVEVLSCSSTARPRLHEQAEPSMSFSVLQSLGPLFPSNERTTKGESAALLDEDSMHDCSTLGSSVRDRAIEACASMPFSRAQLASLDVEQRSSTCERPGQKRRTTRPRFGNPDCS